MDVDDLDLTDAFAPRFAHSARARSRVTMQAATLASVTANSMAKGDVIGTARFAGVQAAQNAATLLPRGSSILVGSTSIDFELGDDCVDVEARVECGDLSGAQFSAITAVTAAALAIYDMCKSADHTMIIGPVELVENP